MINLPVPNFQEVQAFWNNIQNLCSFTFRRRLFRETLRNNHILPTFQRGQRCYRPEIKKILNISLLKGEPIRPSPKDNGPLGRLNYGYVGTRTQIVSDAQLPSSVPLYRIAFPRIFALSQRLLMTAPYRGVYTRIYLFMNFSIDSFV